MNLVPREEFDAMKAVAQAAREAQIKLEARVAALEAKLGAGAQPGTPAVTMTGSEESDSPTR